MSRYETPDELNEWAESLYDTELDYLLGEARIRTSSDQQHNSALDAKVVAIVGWAIVGVGTLLIAGNLAFDVSNRGVAAILAVVGASIALCAGVSAMWPRVWASGLDLGWYSEWKGPELHSMKARGLAALVHGANLNQQTLKLRSVFFRVAAFGLVLEFAALVAALILNVNGD